MLNNITLVETQLIALGVILIYKVTTLSNSNN